MPSYEFRDGEMVEVPDLVIDETTDVHEDVSRTVTITNGATVTVHGSVSGTLNVQQGATLIAEGQVSGTVHVQRGSEATFNAQASGTIHVERGATATLGPSATAFGMMKIDGVLVNHGARGKQVHGSGTVDDREGSTIREPDETWADGTTVYYG